MTYMKHALSLLLLIFILVFNIGCTDDPFGVTTEVDHATPTSLSLTLTQKGGLTDLVYGSEYHIEVYSDGEWKEPPYLPSEYERAWTSIAYLLSPNSSVTLTLNWEDLYGPLPDGRYRVCKEIMRSSGTGEKAETRLYTAEFVIETDKGSESKS